MRKDKEAHKRQGLHIPVKPSKMNSCTGIQICRVGGRDVPKHINRELYPWRDEQSPSLFGCMFNTFVMIIKAPVWVLHLVIYCGLINLSAI